MKVALDLDNTINADKNSIEFFSVITNLLIPEHRIYIITNREPNTEQEIANELHCLGIEYNEIVITADKAKYIREQGISIFFEDSDRYFLEIGEETTVFKIREYGNFSFSENKWLTSRRNSILIDE